MVFYLLIFFIDINVLYQKLSKFKERNKLMTRKEVGFEEHIMSKDKYTSTFSRKIEAIVFLILKIFCNAREKAFTKQIMFNDKYTSALSFKYFAAREVYEQLTLFCVGCILMSVLWYYFMNKQTYLILYNIRSERKI